jgi:DNA invertase Pin-like site-specific DNA recombinase
MYTNGMERVYVRGSDKRIETNNQVQELRAVSPSGILYLDVRSGSKKRVELERMISECQKGDVIWIWALDRLTREGIYETLDYLKRITAKGARVRSLKEEWLDTKDPMAEMRVCFMAYGAKAERSRMIERTVSGIKRSRAASGNPVLNQRAIAGATGSLREVGRQFGCSGVYVLKCRRTIQRQLEA